MAGPAVSLRPVTAGDDAFLHRLYADRRAPELGPLDWPLEQVRAFVDMQFRAQSDGYAATFPDADHWLVLAGEEPIGRLMLDRRPHEHLVVDVVILSDHRGKGIGTALMQEVIAGARDAGLPVRLTVAAHDLRVVRWYEGLGFRLVEPGEVYAGMLLSPAGEA